MFHRRLAATRRGARQATPLRVAAKRSGCRNGLDKSSPFFIFPARHQKKSGCLAAGIPLPWDSTSPLAGTARGATMPLARRGIQTWSMGLLAFALMLGVCRSFFAEESATPTAPPAEAASSFGESGTPDAPPAKAKQKSAKAKQQPAPAQTNRRHHPHPGLPWTKARQGPAPAPSPSAGGASSLFPFSEGDAADTGRRSARPRRSLRFRVRRS